MERGRLPRSFAVQLLVVGVVATLAPAASSDVGNRCSAIRYRTKDVRNHSGCR